ncbi:MAG: DUF1292 domain-containing protein [Butyribacter sp.]|nr:DUF1292 domain-containing protein [bacterium]MDY3854547.1 DUF1292 domain-containing protein [Butyribacter sp.]
MKFPKQELTIGNGNVTISKETKTLVSGKGAFMNKKNQELFFSEEQDEVAVITLTDEDGKDVEAEVVAALEIEELGKEYIAVMPIQPAEDFEEGEAVVLEYSEDENGEPVFDNIDESEYDIVTQAFDQFMAEIAGEDEEYDEEYVETGDLIDDIEEILPGISIKKD